MGFSEQLVRFNRGARGGGGGGASSEVVYLNQFLSTENPLSDSAKILNGLADGLLWQNMRATAGTPGLGFGASVSSSTDDCIAQIKASVGISPIAHYSWGIVNRNGGYVPPDSHEVEMHVGTTITANSIFTYELDFQLGGSIIPVRWNGTSGSVTPNGTGNWTNAPVGDAISDLQNNDLVMVLFQLVRVAGVLCPKITTIINNGAQIQSVLDTSVSKILSGQPGIGEFMRTGVGADLAAYCWKTWGAGSIVSVPTRQSIIRPSAFSPGLAR